MTHIPNFIVRPKSIRGMNEIIDGRVHDTLQTAGVVLALLCNKTLSTGILITSTNLITTAGLTHYAQRGAGETPTNFNGTTNTAIVLGTAGNAPAAGSDYADITTKVTGSLKQLTTGYPTSNDSDSDNTGSGATVTTFQVSYLTSEANASNIDRVAVTNWASGSPGTNEPLLMYATVSSFTKTSSDTLKMIINHTKTSA